MRFFSRVWQSFALPQLAAGASGAMLLSAAPIVALEGYAIPIGAKLAIRTVIAL